jgi:hypothetical protein
MDWNELMTERSVVSVALIGLVFITGRLLMTGKTSDRRTKTRDISMVVVSIVGAATYYGGMLLGKW